MLKDCREISYDWQADKLDCSVSFARQKYDCSFEEILGRLKEDAYVVVINRGTWGDVRIEGKEHFEIGFRSMELPVDYFLFIYVESEKMPPILEKYHLSPLRRRNLEEESC
jgi:hypothetical protein